MNNVSATLALIGVNTYTGQTSVTSGILQLTASNNIAAPWMRP